jgi:cytochrome c oxidase cbb3-type subunit 3
LSLYGGTRATLLSQVSSPKHGVMPSWIGRLGAARVKQLAVYVHSLGGGEKAKPEND